MATNDILFADPLGPQVGARQANVGSGATTINPGEPVQVALGATTVTIMDTNKPVVATDFLAGISTTTSTQTASVAGVVYYIPLVPGQSFLVNPNSAAAWNTQAEYDALVGDRVLMDLTTGSYTLLATDGATNGWVVLPMTVTENPGKVKVALRNGVSNLT